MSMLCMKGGASVISGLFSAPCDALPIQRVTRGPEGCRVLLLTLLCGPGIDERGEGGVDELAMDTLSETNAPGVPRWFEVRFGVVGCDVTVGESKSGLADVASRVADSFSNLQISRYPNVRTLN